MCHEAQMSLIVLDRNLINTAQGDEGQRHRGSQIRVYAYSEARQKPTTLLEQAAQEGEVKIKRKDEQAFVIRPEKKVASPSDVEGMALGITAMRSCSSPAKGTRPFTSPAPPILTRSPNQPPQSTEFLVLEQQSAHRPQLTRA